MCVQMYVCTNLISLKPKSDCGVTQEKAKFFLVYENNSNCEIKNSKFVFSNV